MYMRKILYILISIGLLSNLNVIGQQDPMLSQYMFNGLFLNPAYAGSHEYSTATTLYRGQWVGFKGAPHTGILSYDAPLAKNTMGLGGIISFDHIGVSNKMDISANYSYHIKIGKKSKLALGMRAQLSYYWTNFEDLIYWDANDPTYQNNINTFMPNFGVGAYFYMPRFYAGFSVPTVLSYNPAENLSSNLASTMRQERHYLLTAGYAIPLSKKFDLKPSFLMKLNANAPVEFDINLNLLYNNLIWVGASYRTMDGIVAMIEVQATKFMRIGYAFDYPVQTAMRNYQYGSHEIMLAFDFGKKDYLKVRSPRYF
jgi:type IX secretion system PorP/SprF family membrane protein